MEEASGLRGQAMPPLLLPSGSGSGAPCLRNTGQAHCSAEKQTVSLKLALPG